MKKSSIIYLLMFMCAFVLPSFTFSVEKEKNDIVVHKASTSDTVNITFSNPKVIVTDDRVALERKLDSQEESSKELISVVKETNLTLKDMVKLQERGYESYMDRLERVTGNTPSEIQSFFRQAKNLNKLLIVLTIVFISALLAIYNSSYRRLKEVIYAPIILTISVWLAVVLILKWLWPIMMGEAYSTFYELIRLSTV